MKDVTVPECHSGGQLQVVLPPFLQEGVSRWDLFFHGGSSESSPDFKVYQRSVGFFSQPYSLHCTTGPYLTETNGALELQRLY